MMNEARLGVGLQGIARRHRNGHRGDPAGHPDSWRHGLHRGNWGAQHWRDSRITTIYEGTTGIQANDLVFRKLLRDDGATARRGWQMGRAALAAAKNLAAGQGDAWFCTTKIATAHFYPDHVLPMAAAYGENVQAGNAALAGTKYPDRFRLTRDIPAQRSHRQRQPRRSRAPETDWTRSQQRAPGWLAPVPW